jgi:hypothetical protein
MEILGHSQIALAMNTYSHVSPEVSREAAERMARMLWQDADKGQDDNKDTMQEDGPASLGADCQVGKPTDRGP